MYHCDKDGDPVFINNVCQTDFDMLLNNSNIEDVETFLVLFFQRILHIAFPIASSNKD